MASYQWPPVSAGGSGSGVDVYANLAAFPAASSVTSGTLAVAADTSSLYESNASSWLLIANPGTVTDVAAATTLNTASTIVKRDGSGNFAAGTITATLTGNVTGTVTGHATLDLPLTGGIMSGAIAMGGSKVTGLGAPSANGDALRYDQLGAVSGIATLDGSGKVPVAQLPPDAVTSVNSSTGVVTVNAINQLTGDVTASAASGSQSKASALVATTNATLTTLSALTTAAALVSVGTITTGTWSATTIALNKGGTGQTTKAAAYDALSPLAALGDTVYGGASGTGTALAGNTTSTKKFLTQTGTGSVSAAPAWGTIVGADVPVVVPGTSSGVVSSSGVTGNTTGSAIAAGFVGETIYGPSNKTTSYGALTTATVKNLATLTLTSAGVWLITANATIKQTNNAFVATTGLDFTVSATSSSSMTGCSGNNLNIDYGTLWPRSLATNAVDSGQIVFTYVATTAAQLWLNGLVSFSGGTASASGGFMAVRIA